MSNSPTIISLNITKFPQNLLIPDMDNDVSIQIVSNSNKTENFRFGFEGENLEVFYKSEPLKDQVEFGPNETKNVAGDHPEIVSTLRRQLDAGWKKAL